MYQSIKKSLRKINTNVLIVFLENCFYKLGLAIGKRPWWTINLSVIFCLICTAGVVFWNENTDDEELWTPYGSPYVKERYGNQEIETIKIVHAKLVQSIYLQ